MQHAVPKGAGHAPVQRRQTGHDDAPGSKVTSSMQGHHFWLAGRVAAGSPRRSTDGLEDISNQSLSVLPLVLLCCRAANGNGLRGATVGNANLN